MPRRHLPQEHENSERWLVSYADFITLLFAFFVVMYSISSVNEGKYRVLSETLDDAFSSKQVALDVIPVGDEPVRSLIERADLVSTQEGTGPTISDDPSRAESLAEASSGADALDQLQQDVGVAFSELIDDNLLTVSGNEHWVEIEMKSGLLFESGDSIPSNAAFSILKKLAKLLEPYANPMHIEGFTDNQPINTERFPTNWELSVARSAMIVRMLANYGVNPRQMSAVGYGEFWPVDSNATAVGRANNRRVVLVISRSLEVRRGLYPVGVDNASPSGSAQFR